MAGNIYPYLGSFLYMAGLVSTTNTCSHLNKGRLKISPKITRYSNNHR